MPEMSREEKQPKKKKENRNENGKTEKSPVRKIVVLCLFVLLSGFVLELFCNLPALRTAPSERRTEIAPDAVSYEGFRLKDGVLKLTEESGTIHIPVHGKYVDQLFYSYDYDGLLNTELSVSAYNIYGELRERDKLFIQDRNSRVLKESHVKIGKKADSIDLTVSRAGLFEPGLSYLDFSTGEVRIKEIRLDAVPALNGYRLCFFWCVIGLFTLLFMGKNLFAKKIELGFLVISLTVGTLLSWSLPANKVSWDEEIHFAQAFWMSNYRTPVPLSPTITQEFIAGVDTWPYNQPGTDEEQKEFNAYLNRTGDYKNGEILWSTDLNKTIMTGYAGTAVLLKIGQILHLPFSILFKLGRLGNLFVYCIVLYFAIKKTPVGKGIMAFLGLMPEPMLLAGVYSYDPTVTAFLYLSFAYLLWAVLTPEEKITWKEYAVILLSFIWGCRVKAVYAPLLLTGLLIPASHYRNEREKRLMRVGLLAAVLLLMASFVLPVLISPSETGDARGNAASEVGQMAYVLGQPLSYAWILICNIRRTLPSYVFGEGTLGMMGHQGTVPFPWLLYTGAAAVILTNGQSSCGKRLNGKQKLWIFLCCAAAVVLVWTSMYLVFTTPGNTYIEGVQGRYYMPFLFLVWLILNPETVSVRLKNEDYYRLTLLAGGGILLASYYTNVLTKFCL